MGFNCWLCGLGEALHSVSGHSHISPLPTHLSRPSQIFKVQEPVWEIDLNWNKVIVSRGIPHSWGLATGPDLVGTEEWSSHGELGTDL